MNIITHSHAHATTSHLIPTVLGKLHVVEAGTGNETLVLWPSIFTDHHIYDDLVRRLGTHYRFVLIDGPGHGRSEGRAVEFTMAQCANAMEAVLDHFGLTQAVVGGTSWGGLTAAELALAMPERVKALILMNTPIEIDRRAPSLYARMIAMGARWMPGSATFRNGVARSFFSPAALQDNTNYARAFHDMLKGAKPRVLAAAIRSVILRGTPLKHRMAELSVPVLVIAGKDDTMYPIEGQAEAALLAPHGQFEPVAGKHISVVEQPEIVAHIMTSFIARQVAQ